MHGIHRSCPCEVALSDEKVAKRLGLECSRFTIQNGVLFYVDVALTLGSCIFRLSEEVVGGNSWW